MYQFFFFALFIFFAGCNSQSDHEIILKHTESNELQLITFGSGGGFTGLWTGYQILADGTVNQWQGELSDSTSYEFFTKLSPSKLEQIKNVLTDPIVESTKENDPGNFSYLLKLPNQETVVWNNSTKNSDGLATILETLRSIVENVNRGDSTQTLKNWPEN